MIRYEDIQQRMGELAKQVNLTNKLRQLWKTSTKEVIVNELIYYRDELLKGWDVRVDEAWLNKGSVTLYLPANKSDIYRLDQDGETGYIKHESALVFAQLINGLIAVIVRYPYIEELQQQKPDKRLATMNPKELLDTDVIDGFIAQYLDELIAWERNDEEL
jgi:hypothetical protein